MRMVTKREQRRDISISPHDHIPASATVPAIRSTFGNVRLTPKRDCPRTPVATPKVDLDLVNEGGGLRHGQRIRVHSRAHPELNVSS